jgi:Tfp pilus assembly protein PilF
MKKEIKKGGIKNSKPNLGTTNQSNVVPGIWVILVLTFIAYLPVLKSDFVNWDDMEYVYENSLITSFSNFSKIISTPVQGNIHPLTMLSLTFNYSLSGYHAWSYHLLNLILHLANAFLVFTLVKKLSKGNAIISLTTALLFALHPMHVESVAWISERKDVLYAFFFLIGLIAYTNYIDKLSGSSYILCIIWLLLALASKPAAVIFPFVLFAIDFLRKRKLSLKLLAEKIPFFLLALITGYFTLHNQSGIGATEGQDYFGMKERIFFGFYGFMMYFMKAILPINLAAFYPFPPVNQSLPVIYYLSPLFFIAVIVLCIALYKKSNIPAFGFIFYFLNLFLVLQFFIVGSAITADRYTYVPYIGLFFIAGWLLDKLYNHSLKKSFVALIPVALMLTIMTNMQAATWKNSATLWDHAIEVYPSFRAYNNRGLQYKKDGNIERAMECYNKAIELNHTDAEVYCNRGNVFSQNRKFSEALVDYNNALRIKPGYSSAYENRGALYGAMGKPELAVQDLSQVIKSGNAKKNTYANRGTAFMDAGKYEEAIGDFNAYLQMSPNSTDILNSIAVCYQYQKKYEESIQIFDKMISIDPQPVFLLNRSYSWKGLNKLDEAKKDALSARQSGIQIPPAYAAMLGI